MNLKKLLVLLILICIPTVLILSFSYSHSLTESSYLNIDNTDQEYSILPKPSDALSPKNAYAIVIGISDYPGSSDDLSYCDDDAQDVYDVLIEEYNFKSENIIYLQDSSATKSGIDSAFNTINAQITENDIFFFYYSGHGGASMSSEGIVYYNIDSPHPYPNNYDRTWSIYHPEAVYMRVYFDHLETESGYDWVYLGDTDIYEGWIYEGYSGYSSGFWSGWIPLLSDNRLYIRFISDNIINDWGFSIDRYEAMAYDGTHYLCSYDSIPSSPENYYLDTLIDSKLDAMNAAEKYIIIDSCHSGGIIPEVQDIGRYIMTACGDDEFSLECPGLQHGVFTNYFLNSINSATDTNGDGVLSMEECFSYIYSNTLSYSSSLGYTHHPQQYDGISGESILKTSFASLSLTPNENQLSYSFSITGVGTIENLKLVIYSLSSTVDYLIEDLSISAPSDTGFGYYSGLLELTGATNITGYGLYANIQGNSLIQLSEGVSGDFDGDGLDDAFEIMMGLDCLNPDTDNDGLLDGEEINIYFTDPLNPDTDNDGLLDGEEIYIYFTDPLNPDTDGDGFPDGMEVAWGTDPLDPDSSLLNSFSNILGIAFLISASYFVTRTTLVSKKQKKKSTLSKSKLTLDTSKTFNAVKVETKEKPKPVIKTYAPTYTQRPIYPHTSTVAPLSPVEIDRLRNMILYQLPPPKNPYSKEGKLAMNVANLAMSEFNKGDILNFSKHIIQALILGVPEPMNSSLKLIMIDILDKMSKSVSYRQTTPTSISPSLPQPLNDKPQISPDFNYCAYCGQKNKSTNKFCQYCGRSI